MTKNNGLSAWWWCLGLIVVLFSASVWSQDNIPDSLTLTVSLPEKRQYFIKQLCPVTVELLSNGQFAGEPSVTFPDSDDYMLLPIPIDKGPVSKTVEGNTLGGITMTFAVFPLKTGILTIPALSVQAVVIDDQGKASKTLSKTSKAFVISVMGPSGVNNVDDVVVAETVDISDKWSTVENALAVGQSLERIIRIRAEGTLGMLVPDPVVPQTPTIRYYASSVSRQDQTQRGVLSTQVEQRLTYMPEQAGTVVLPAVEWVWMNSRNGQMKTIRLPEKVLTIALPGSEGAAGEASISEGWRGIVVWLLFVVLLLAFVFGGVWVFNRQPDSWKRLFKARLLIALCRVFGTTVSEERVRYAALKRAIRQSVRQKKLAKELLSPIQNWLYCLNSKQRHYFFEQRVWKQVQLSALNQQAWLDEAALLQAIRHARKEGNLSEDLTRKNRVLLNPTE